MYPYAVQRYRDLQGWIPRTDIDGIDAKETFVSDTENVDFNNGFFCNAVKPIEETYDIEIVTLQNAGYEVLSVKDFYHKDRGDCTFYLMYKFTGGLHHELAYFVKDKDGYKQLKIDEQSQSVVPKNKPSNISYSYTNGQLKVNLNVIGEYTAIQKSGVNRNVYLNLSLDYLTRRMYNADIIANAERPEGWYLFPRYLGWSYGDTVPIVNNDQPVSLTHLDFEGSHNHGTLNGETLQYSAGAVLNSADAPPPSSGTEYLKLTDKGDYFTIKGCVKPSRVTFLSFCGNADVKMKVIIKADGDEIASKIVVGEYSWVQHSIDILKISGDVEISFRFYDEPPASSVSTYIDDIKVEYGSEYKYTVIAKYSDNQRGMLENGTAVLFNDGAVGKGTRFVFSKPYIDWRVTDYEVYIQPEENGLYYKYINIPVNNYGSGAWSDTAIANAYTFTPLNPISYIDLTKPGVETLNSNYGLNYNVKAYKEDINEFGYSDTYLIGNIILQEITYRHRQYFVNGDEKLYMSHIAGSGLSQPDSFPYNKDVKFGYLITDENERNLALAVTPLDELTIFGKDKSYVYYMQIIDSTVVRKIKAINGGIGISSAKALAVDSSGHSQGLSLFWVDKQGAYLYVGGRQEPKSVTNQTHKNYWLCLPKSIKDNMIVGYNRMKAEYWIVAGQEVIIYEALYGRFKKYKFEFTIKEFLGVKENKFRVLGTDGSVYVIDPCSNVKLTGTITTHYSTNTLILGKYPVSSWEWQHKILQDLYVAIKNGTTGFIDYIIMADEVSLPAIMFSTRQLREAVPSPLLVRYGKIAIKLRLPANTSCVKEFGYSFSVPSQGVGDIDITKAASGGLGQSAGTQLGINQ